MRNYLFAAALAIAGCTEKPATAPGAPPFGAQQAYFTSYPQRFFDAAALACNRPGQSVVAPNRNELRCESLPDPQSAAALILQFDGSVQDLPVYVIAFQGIDTVQGYLVTADNYIRVPQRTGGAQQIRFPDPDISREMGNILQAAGGRLL
ncbi:MAG: hypothetical protein KJP02_12575 [Octadecabacter sp.]|nr:hypothetical protein [Octadecabacter sp.]